MLCVTVNVLWTKVGCSVDKLMVMEQSQQQSMCHGKNSIKSSWDKVPDVSTTISVALKYNVGLVEDSLSGKNQLDPFNSIGTHYWFMTNTDHSI